jgi:hypothetical protein
MITHIKGKRFSPAADYIFKIAEKEKVRLSEEDKLFIAGIKPAILPTIGFCSKTKEASPANTKFFKRFYSYIYFPHRGSTLFFQSRENMNLFLLFGTYYYEGEWSNYEKVLDFKQYDLGIALGYPPAAVEWFTKSDMDEEGNYVPRAFVNYHGMRFACATDMVVECIHWLEDNRPVPDELKSSITARTPEGFTVYE